MYPSKLQPQYTAPPPAIIPAEARPAHALARLAKVRTDLHNATYPMLVRDRVMDLLDVLEFLLTGQAPGAERAMGPALAVGPDPQAARVQMGQVLQAGTPVVAGGQVLLHGVSHGHITGGDTGVLIGNVSQSGQKVEFYDGPETRAGNVTSGLATNNPAGVIEPAQPPTHNVEAGGIVQTLSPAAAVAQAVRAATQEATR